MNGPNRLADILSVYNTSRLSSSVEFELRFREVDVGMFKDLYSKLYTDGAPTIECTINIISRSSTHDSHIRTLTFVRGVKTHDKYSMKKSLSRPVHVKDAVDYTLNVNQEGPSEAFKPGPTAHVRIKLRASFTRADWRIDLTAVKDSTMQAISSELVNIKKQMFPEDISAENFLQRVQYDMIDKYEIEAEWIGQELHSEQVTGVLDMLRPLMAGESAAAAQYKSAIIAVNKRLYGRRDDVGLKRLLNQAIALSKNSYVADIYPPVGYYVTDKADGIRCCAHFVNGQLNLIADKLYTFNGVAVDGGLDAGSSLVGMLIQHLGIFAGSDQTTDSEQTTDGEHTDAAVTEPGDDRLPEPTIVDAVEIICDCELLTNPMKILLFDCMYYDGLVTQQTLGPRIQYLSNAAKQLSRYLPCEVKKMVRIHDKESLRHDFDEISTAKHDYTTDGLIITEPDKPYETTKNYKWKPAENTTIDFMAVLCPSTMLGVDPYKKVPGKDLYLLFVGIAHKVRTKLGLGLLPDYKKMFSARGEYYPVQFSPSIDKYAYLYYHDPAIGPIDHKVVELRRIMSDTPYWDFVRIRTDREHEKNYYGNDFRVAEITYMNYIDPFSYEDLIAPQTGYFARESFDIYVASNKYRRFVISLLIKNNFAGAKYVIDEAAGRGADLHRYQEVGVLNTLFIDVDKSAIVELVRRKFDMFNMKRRRVQQWTGGSDAPEIPHAMTVHTMVRDLTLPYTTLVRDVSKIVLPGTCDGIVCNFAIHYFCDDIQNLRNLLKFNASMLKLGGCFMFTTLNGAKVFEKLADVAVGEQYEIEDGSADPDYIYGSGSKYIIKKLYSGNKLANCGQRIAVKLPFADELREEPLANIDVIVAECAKLGLEMELNSSFSVYMDKFKQADAALYCKLTTGDKEYISLHQFVTVRRIK